MTRASSISISRAIVTRPKRPKRDNFSRFGNLVRRRQLA